MKNRAMSDWKKTWTYNNKCCTYGMLPGTNIEIKSRH